MKYCGEFEPNLKSSCTMSMLHIHPEPYKLSTSFDAFLYYVCLGTRRLLLTVFILVTN